MANIMTKRGSIDNEITYEHICDTAADMASIDKQYKTLGSVCIVIQGESGGLEVYMAGSNREWASITEIGGSNSEENTLGLYVCTNDEIDAESGLPDVSAPAPNTIYLVASREDTNNIYDEFVYVDEAWERVGGVTLDLSTYAPKASPEFTGSISLNRAANTIPGENSIAVGYHNAANGLYSAAFGRDNVANGTSSFAGGENTIAAGGSEFVIGSSNALPAAEFQPNTEYAQNDYVIYQNKLYYCASAHTSAATFEADSGWYHARKNLLTVGNGNNSNSRSNAFVVDLVGNGHYKGDIYIGCNADSSGGYKVAKDSDVSLKADKDNTVITGSLSLGRKAGTTVGAGSAALGYNAIVTSQYSTGFGYEVNVNGSSGNHGEGYKTNVSGSYGIHAEGYYSKASGNSGIHSEGYYTFASGNSGIHSEGYYTFASGDSGIHAEGYGTKAQGYNGAHAEGCGTLASNTGAHAEGYGTISITNNNEVTSRNGPVASGLGSHAEGYGGTYTENNTTKYYGASGEASHSEGYQTLAIAQAAHAEGYQTKATAYTAHAEGSYTVASGSCSHAEGYGGTFIEDGQTKSYGAIGPYSHSEGYLTLAESWNSHTEGHSTRATQSNAHAEGYYTRATNAQAHAEGYGYDKTITVGNSTHNTGANGYCSHSEGYDTCANGDSAHAEGRMTVASGDDSHAEGNYTLASGYYSHAEGSNTIANGYGSHSEGYNSKASGMYAHAEGNGTTASGTYSHTEGCYTAASESYSHAEGYHTTASSNYTHAEGYYTTASASNTHAEGYYSQASGEYSHVEGYYTIAKGKYSHVFGKYNIEDTYNNLPEWTANTEYSVGDKVKRTNGSSVIAYKCKTANNDASFTQSKWDYIDGINYIEIVGNGNYNTRSNARALDWEGNEHLQGDLYINCNVDSTGGSAVGARIAALEAEVASLRAALEAFLTPANAVRMEDGTPLYDESGNVLEYDVATT